jgi:hypothetical protein
MVNYLATRALMSTFMLFTVEPCEVLSPRTSHAHLLDRVYVEKAIVAEARLRTQVRLRTRLAAERRLLSRDSEGEGSADTGLR